MHFPETLSPSLSSDAVSRPDCDSRTGPLYNRDVPFLGGTSLLPLTLRPARPPRSTQLHEAMLTLRPELCPEKALYCRTAVNAAPAPAGYRTDLRGLHAAGAEGPLATAGGEKRVLALFSTPGRSQIPGSVEATIYYTEAQAITCAIRAFTPAAAAGAAPCSPPRPLHLIKTEHGAAIALRFMPPLDVFYCF